MWTDNDTDKDFLNFTGVAQTVAEIIVQAKSKPVSIGVSGAWGVGKSSMIKLIKKSLESHPEDSEKFVFVEFNAWLYQGYDDARAALMEVIAERLKEESQKRKTGVDKAIDLLRRVNWIRVAKLTFGTTASIALGLPPVGLAGDATKLAVDAISGNFNADSVKKSEEVAKEIGKEANGILNPKNESSPPKEIQAIRDGFEEILQKLDVTLVVLIDDLDRCLPETTISTLEAIRLFLFLEHTAFVIAADNEMIKHAVRKHFDGVSDDLVTNYFDKLIQVPIRVPPLGTQEVRAYMMLLFLEDDSVDSEKRERIRGKVCEQLGKSWQGKRVDRTFIQSLNEGLSIELATKFELAERLSHIMVTNSKIMGNPRLIKRFLNAISIRKSIAKANGIDIDEKALTKLLLFERCAPQKAYSELLSKVAENTEGKPRFLAAWEKVSTTDESNDLPDPWNDEFIKQWLRIPPAFSDMDLRGILYVSREHASLVSPEDRLSPEATELLEALFKTPDVASTFSDRLKSLARTELNIMMDRLLEKAKLIEDWGSPPILSALLVLTLTDTALGARLKGFLMERPHNQIKPAIVPKIRDYLWAEDLLDEWKNGNVGQTVKRAIEQKGEAK
ncbi:MAG: hypothetical protein KDD48_02795 [Bdellovibrionales bacterium]|nr:hypothetical protein [Bdellovibrionales bacterium]